MDGREMASPHSHVPKEGSSCLLLFRKPSQKSELSPPVCPKIPSEPCLCLCHPPAWWHSVLCFISRVRQGFKTLTNFRNLARCKPTLILWGRSRHTVAPVSLSQKSSCVTVQGFGIYGRPQPKAGIQVSCLQQVPLLVC